MKNENFFLACYAANDSLKAGNNAENSFFWQLLGAKKALKRNPSEKIFISFLSSNIIVKLVQGGQEKKKLLK